MNQSIFAPGRTAVIFGGADGIGRAAAARFAGMGLHLVLADLSADALGQAAVELSGSGIGVTTAVLDVGDRGAVEALRDGVLASGADISIVMNNAGRTSGRAGAWSDADKWRQVFDTNFWGAVNGTQAFVPPLIAAGRPAAIINTGSKQGITNPPGDLAYNCTKAALKTMTEGLQHALRSTPGCQVTAHLLVPGFTYTGMMRQHFAEKPPGAWTAEQVVERMIEGLNRGDFYILCPDNETTEAMDALRITWGAQDMTLNRPALSRWHPDYKAAFERHMASGGAG